MFLNYIKYHLKCFLFKNLLYICSIKLKQLKLNIMKTTSFELKKHWSDRLAKLQIKNRQNENFGIGENHSDIRFKLTQLAIKFKL